VRASDWAQRAQQMGQLARGEARWDVFLEISPDPEQRLVRGRVHFLDGERHRASAWIFVEWSERELRERFTEFSATELWSLLESLGP
jgi:hypothetical protein